MFLADYHTHSDYSADAAAQFSMVQMAQGALEKGLRELCFTDHLEVADLWTGRTVRPDWDWHELERRFSAAQAEIGDRLTLRLGAEVGDAICDLPAMDRILDSAPETLDFTIGSMHVLPEKWGRTDLAQFRPTDEAQAMAIMRDYLEDELALTKWGRFDVLGHLTLPIRSFRMNRKLDVSFDPMEEQIREILKLAAEKGLGLEINANKGLAPIPEAKWLRIFREYGGEIVTTGSDAHKPEHAGLGIEQCQDVLRSCGFRAFCTYERRKPIFHDL